MGERAIHPCSSFSIKERPGFEQRRHDVLVGEGNDADGGVEEAALGLEVSSSCLALQSIKRAPEETEEEIIRVVEKEGFLVLEDFVEVAVVGWVGGWMGGWVGGGSGGGWNELLYVWRRGGGGGGRRGGWNDLLDCI